MISGIVTAVLLLVFLGIAVWAWSARNRERWQRAAESPLHDDAPPGGDSSHAQNQKKRSGS